VTIGGKFCGFSIGQDTITVCEGSGKLEIMFFFGLREKREMSSSFTNIFLKKRFTQSGTLGKPFPKFRRLGALGSQQGEVLLLNATLTVRASNPGFANRKPGIRAGKKIFYRRK